MEKVKTAFVIASFCLWISFILSQPCAKDACDEVKCSVFNSCDLILPNVTHCGCCNMCVNYVKENERCEPITIQELSWPVQKPRLHCKYNHYCNSAGKCVLRNTTCLSQLKQYLDEKDEGWRHIGKEQPRCDENGDFKVKQCFPGSMCYCVNREGHRIFGESRPGSEDDTDCRCSRQLYNLLEVLKPGLLLDNDLNSWLKEDSKYLSHFLRCTATGDYDTLQCFKDECFCLDKDLNEQYTSRTRKYFYQLPCYDPNKHSEEYVRECEKELNMKLDQIKNSTQQDRILVGFDLPTCDLDGSYSPKQCRNTTCYCADKDGNKIGNYKVPRHSYKAKHMHCDCARENLFLENNFLTKRVKCKPETGNYALAQCLSSECFCAENGMQVTKEFKKFDYDDVEKHCEEILQTVAV